MRGVILAAGRGSRMGDHTAEVPKAFIEIEGRTLYDRQRAALAPHVDGITVVLGYRAENVRDRIGPAEAIVLEDWDSYDNAESLRRALVGIEDDVIVMNGDVVVSSATVGALRDRFAALGGAYNVVGHLPGRQTDHSAIRVDDDGTVREYGMIEGLRHAGVGVVGRRHRRAAVDHLWRHRTEWYPLLYCATPTRAVEVPASQHVELNRPADLIAARDALPPTPASGDAGARG